MWIFAHRGAVKERRNENTVAAFRAALQRGAHLESDVRLSRDRVAVLVHDSWVRDGLCLRRVGRLRHGQLRRRGVATVDDVYDELGTDFEFSVDVKIAAAAQPLIDIAVSRAVQGRLWLVSDQFTLLERLRSANPDVRLVHESRLRDIGEPEPHATRLAAAGIDAQNTDAFDWNQQMVDHVHRCGLLAFGSLANDVERLERARALGLDAVYTDDLDLAAQVLGA